MFRLGRVALDEGGSLWRDASSDEEHGGSESAFWRPE
jgi:hypothetical protein